MKRISGYILTIAISLLVMLGCDVHEFPVDNHERVPFVLHLNFDTEMSFHKEIPYTRANNAEEKGEPDPKDVPENYDIRYVINAYRTDNVRGENRQADTTFVFTKDEIKDLNYTAHLALPEGDYNLRVWADYVNKGSNEDKYYDTQSYGFEEIILSDLENHVGSNEFRDAFRGSVNATVLNPALYRGSAVNQIDNSATVKMQRPMGKFKFVSTDVEIFLTRVAQMLKEKGLLSVDIAADEKAAFEQLMQSINLGDFYVIFKYDIFMPCSFNMFTDEPADTSTGTTFKSRMYIEGDGDEREMTLGYDYVFVNDNSGTTLSLSLQVFNRDDELMSSSNPVNVPILRNKLTIVRGEFLTSRATGGITINPGWDGDDYNVEIK